jgi:hypothetical protein
MQKIYRALQLRNILSARAMVMSVRESWTDERLDDLNKKVDQGFARLDADMRALDGRGDGGLDRAYCNATLSRRRYDFRGGTFLGAG